MQIKYRRLKGTRDIMLLEAERWRWCEDRWREVLERYAFGEIHTPIIEPTELFTRSVGQDTDIVDKEMYTFRTKGDESLTLRPEATASVVRAYLENGLIRQPGTLKFFYIGPMFRHDRPQAGRFRQFHQVGVEAIGSPSPVLDAEVIRACMALFEAVDAEGLTVRLNNIGSQEDRPAYVTKLGEWARANQEQFCPTCRRRLVRNPLRLFDCKIEECHALMADYPPIMEALSDQNRAHHRVVCSLLEELGVPYVEDHTLVRGLDYYTRTTFEIMAESDRKQSALCGGGRYDGLVEQCGGPPTPAIGFSLGIERTIRHLYSDTPDPQRSRQCPIDVYVACLDEASQQFGFLHADILREICRVEVDTTGRAIKAQLKAATQRQAKMVLIVGAEEVKRNEFQLKNLESGAQRAVARDELLTNVREVLGL
ncbi:MAG: histidine--tRNA ligase [bacterium]